MMIGAKIVVPQSLLRPAQVRYCPKMVADKTVTLESHLYRGGALLKVIAVQGSGGIFYSLLDHHHHVLKAIQERATHFEVLVTDIWPEADYHERILQDQQKFSLDIAFYTRTLQNTWQQPFLSMKDLLIWGEKDPLRDFLGRTKVYDFYEDGQRVKTYHPEGEALWRKGLGVLPGDLPEGMIKTPSFAEFILSDVLQALNFDPVTESVKEARHALSQAKTNPPAIFPFVGWEGFDLGWAQVV